MLHVRVGIFWRGRLGELQNINLLCKLNPKRNRSASYHGLPRIDIPGKTHRSSDYAQLLPTGPKLRKLSKYYSVVKTVKRIRDPVTASRTCN